MCMYLGSYYAIRELKNLYLHAFISILPITYRLVLNFVTDNLYSINYLFNIYYPLIYFFVKLSFDGVVCKNYQTYMADFGFGTEGYLGLAWTS